MSEEDGGDEDGDGGGCGGKASPASSFDAFHLLPPFDLAPVSLSPSVTLPPSPISVTMAEDKFCPPFPSNFAA